MKTKIISITLLLLFSMSQSAWAVHLPADTDNDGVADVMEQFLLDKGVTTDDKGDAIAIGATNQYDNTDTDMIPDIIEKSVTLSDPNVDESTRSCNGKGAVNFTSQRAVRIFVSGNANESQNLLQQYLSAISICHDLDTISAFSPLLGFSDTTSSFVANGSGYDMTLTWSNIGGVNGATVELSSTIPLATINSNGSIGGDFIITSNGSTSTFPFKSSRQADRVSVDQIGGVLGLQTKIINGSGPLATVDGNIRNPGSRAGQIVVIKDSGGNSTNEVVWYTEAGEALPGYFVPGIGSLVVASAQTDGNGVKKTILINTLFSRDNSAGSQFRGEYFTEWQATGQTKRQQFENFYGRHGRVVVNGNVRVNEGKPEVVMRTIQRPGRRFTRLSYFNVRLRAEQIQLNGSGISQDLVNVNSLGLSFVDKLRTRNRVKGFFDNPAVGMAGADNQRAQMRISQLMYQPAVGDLTQLLPNGTYNVISTIINDSSADRTHSGNYTASTTPYSVVSGLAFNGISWDKISDITNVGANQTHTISFTHVDQANTRRYQFMLLRADKGELNAVGANRLLVRGDNQPSINIENGILDAGTNYCLRVQAHHSTDRGLRAETDKLCFTTAADAASTSRGVGATLPPPNNNSDISGDWNFNEVVDSANGVCSSEVNTKTTYSGRVVQNGQDFTLSINGQTPTNGTIIGNAIQMTGQRTPEDGGTTTFSFKGVLSGQCIIGTSTWSWTGIDGTCPAGESTIRGTLNGNANACDGVSKPASSATSNSSGGGGGDNGGGGSMGLWLMFVALFGRAIRVSRG